MDAPFCFTFAKIPDPPEPWQEVDWLPLAHSGTPDHDHVQYHSITDSSTLESLQRLGSRKMQALILVNSNDSYDLQQKALPATKWPVPVILVTSSTGKALSDILEHKKVEVRMEQRSKEEPSQQKASGDDIKS